MNTTEAQQQPSAAPESLTALYTRWSGHAPSCVEPLASEGSPRRYYRLTDARGETVIGTVGTSAEEDRAFISLSRHFSERGLPVSRVLAVSPDSLCYLQTDLGERTLYSALSEGRDAGGRYNGRERGLLLDTIRLLPRIQMEGARGLDWKACYPSAAFDGESLTFDLNYFKYCFLKPTGLDFHEVRLEADFRLLVKDLTHGEGPLEEAFMYRDFQARNVMLGPGGTLSLIDYQGGRRGPCYYDLASFVWQASARYSPHLRRELVSAYYDELKKYTEVPPVRQFAGRLALFVLLRTLQVLGAYGYRGYFERKRHFLDSIPPAMDNLRGLLAMSHPFPYPYLMSLLRRITALPQYAPAGREAHPDGPSTRSPYDGQGRLTVRVYSFSYRRGIPEDTTGNGGGYVFDCRSTHNPGRYAPYRKLTGLDGPVIRFLESDGEILRFLDSVYRLADAHVERYLERGFTDLMFSFGCTGGQHRSVYAAQHLAEHLSAKYGIGVRLCHREQGIEKVFPPAPTGGDAGTG